MLMRISKARIDQYRDELNTLADLASDYVKAFVELMLQENPNIGVAELRQATIEAIEESLNVFGVEASSLAGELFDEIMLGEGISAQATVGRTIEAEAVDKKVRTYAQELVNGNAAVFTKKVTDITNYYIKREAFQSMIDNCERNDVKWARIPSGRETCSFCFMLSSQGFVYLSRENAKGAHGMHRNCDCVVVPGVKGVTKIAGYDPEGMRGRWEKIAETVGVDPEDASDERRNKILREVEKRDWKWLYSGKTPKVTYVSDSVKKRVTPEERRTAKRLANGHGFNARFIQDYEWVIKENGRKERIGLPDLENGIEIKTLTTSKNANGAMRNHLDNSREKVGLKRVIVDNSESLYISDDDLVTEARRVIDKYPDIPKLFILLKSGKLVEIK